MQLLERRAVAGRSRYILGETLRQVIWTTGDSGTTRVFLERRTAWDLTGRNLMDPRCSHEPAYEEDAATDHEDLRLCHSQGGSCDNP